jgi:hypothetical protein
MKPSRCLLFDANIVIALFQFRLWQEVVSRCELVLAETVVDEADFFVDENGVEHKIDLQPFIAAGRVKVVAVVASQIGAFRGRFDNLYVQRLDDGETESLVYCLDAGEPYQLCSSDGIVFRVLALLDRSEQGVSLQELLDSLGLSRALEYQYTKSFRDDQRARGFEDKLSGMGLK